MEKENSSKKFIKRFLILILAVAVLIAGTVIFFDPFYHYHKPWCGLKAVLNDKEYQCVGTLRNFDYNALLGDWIFEQNDLPQGVDASADYFTEVAFVLVKEDRTYKTHWYYDDFDHTGTIQAEYEKLSDGTVVPVYIFYENGNTPWIRAYQVPDDPNTFKVGTENLERLVKNTGEG